MSIGSSPARIGTRCGDVRGPPSVREFWVNDGLDGMSTFGGTMSTVDAQIFERSVDAMADTVCPDDPRSKRQRRVDAIAAVCSGAERLPCQCANADCPKKDAVAAPFVIHTITGPRHRWWGWGCCRH